MNFRLMRKHPCSYSWCAASDGSSCRWYMQSISNNEDRSFTRSVLDGRYPFIYRMSVCRCWSLRHMKAVKV